MAKHIRALVLDDSAVATPLHHQHQATKPEFIFAPEMGRKSIDEIETDLVLVPVLAGMKVPRDLHAKAGDVGELIKSAIKDGGFSGKRGDRLLIETDLMGTGQDKVRHVLLAGLGRPDKFCGRTAYEVFEQLIEEAIRLDVRRVTIPFAPNRGTGSCLNMKGMGHKLNAAVTNCFKRLDHPVALSEIQIYCTPQAKAHIQKGLDIPLADDDCHHCGH